MRRLISVGGATAALLAVAGLPASPAAASSGRCPAGEGVTVVVDYGGLGGGVQVGCDLGGAGKPASTVVPNAGFTLSYVTNEPGFVCAVQGRPDPNASCQRTPPSSAYWGLFWSDGTPATWSYASEGARSLDVPKGGSLGWRWQNGGSLELPGAAPSSPPKATPSPQPKPSAQPATTPKPSSTPKPSASARPSGVTSPATRSPAASSSRTADEARAASGAGGGVSTPGQQSDKQAGRTPKPAARQEDAARRDPSPEKGGDDDGKRSVSTSSGKVSEAAEPVEEPVTEATTPASSSGGGGAAATGAALALLAGLGAAALLVARRRRLG